MKPETVQALIAQLESTASSMVSAENVSSLLAHLDTLPKSLSQLGRALTQAEPNQSEAAPLRETSAPPSARECLLHLQRALIYAQSRLQHEHQSLLTQLHELAAQQEWVETSRQST